MGIDCDIVMKMKPGTRPADADYGPYVQWGVHENDKNPDLYSKDPETRWFDRSYPRGHFPTIAKELLQALADDNCLAIYFANDHGLGEEITPLAFMVLCGTWYHNDKGYRFKEDPFRNKSWSELLIKN